LEKKRAECSKRGDEGSGSGEIDNDDNWWPSEGDGEGSGSSLYADIWIETKEKLDLVREVNSTDEQG
jgi:hypothetical protein